MMPDQTYIWVIFPSGTVVHVGRKVQGRTEGPDEDHDVYAPLCQNITRHAATYAGKTQLKVSCAKCLKLITTHPHVYRS